MIAQGKPIEGFNMESHIIIGGNATTVVEARGLADQKCQEISFPAKGVGEGSEAARRRGSNTRIGRSTSRRGCSVRSQEGRERARGVSRSDRGPAARSTEPRMNVA